MKSSPKLRPGFWDIWVVAAVVALAVACAVMLRNTEESAQLAAVVSVDGAEQERVLLRDAHDEPYTVTGNGYTLQVMLEGDAVWVESSDCPTQDCVHTGRISRNGQSIVCLPARVIVQLQGGADSDSPVDLVIG